MLSLQRRRKDLPLTIRPAAHLESAVDSEHMKKREGTRAVVAHTREAAMITIIREESILQGIERRDHHSHQEEVDPKATVVMTTTEKTDMTGQRSQTINQGEPEYKFKFSE